METLHAILYQQSQVLNKFEQALSTKKMSLDEVGSRSEEIFHHSDENFRLQYLNPTGCHWFGIDHEKAVGLGIDFFKKYYHPETLSIEFPNIKTFFDHHTADSIYTNYQQVYHPKEETFAICLVFIKKFKLTCGYLSLILPIDNFQGIHKKLKRLIAEELFRNNHSPEFKQLTDRETEILRLVALGKSNPEIANELYISRCTVEQHRKNINRKLNTKGIRDIMDFAYAFDLV